MKEINNLLNKYICMYVGKKQYKSIVELNDCKHIVLRKPYKLCTFIHIFLLKLELFFLNKVHSGQTVVTLIQ